jgi:hypothetical protein
MALAWGILGAVLGYMAGRLFRIAYDYWRQND